MKKWIYSLAAMAALASAGDASAFGWKKHPYGYGFGGGAGAGGGEPRVGFVAAPWYLYWPYDGHFQTPAPMQGAFYPPPAVYGTFAQPYFPTYPVPTTTVPPVNPGPAVTPLVPLVPAGG